MYFIQQYYVGYFIFFDATVHDILWGGLFPT